MLGAIGSRDCPETILVTSIRGGTEVSARLGRAFTARPGAAQRLHVDARQIHLFDPSTTLAIARPPS